MEWGVDLSKTTNSVPNMLKSARRYYQVMRWILADSILRFRTESFLVICSGLAGLVIQFAVVAAAIYYIGILESGKEITVYQYSIQPRTSSGLLIAVSVLLLIALVSSSGMIYYSRRGIIRLRVKYEKFCIERVLVLLGSKNPFFGAQNGNSLFLSHFQRLIGTDANYCGRALQNVVNIVRPALTLLFSFVVLLYVNYVLTAAVFMLIAVYSYFQYRIGLLAAKHSTLMEKLSQNVNLDKKQWLNTVSSFRSSASIRESPDRWAAHQLNREGVSDYYASYEKRFTTVETSTYVSHLFFAVCLVFILFYLVEQAISYDYNWSTILVYVLGLRYGFVSLTQTSRILTSVNQIYPQCNRYYKSITILTEETDEAVLRDKMANFIHMKAGVVPTAEEDEELM